MEDQLIDVETVALYSLEIRVNPEDRDRRMDELVELYGVQQRLIQQREDDLLEIAVFRAMLMDQWGE
jgi:hypothetical protein